jgi:hypothetical protein
LDQKSIRKERLNDRFGALITDLLAEDRLGSPTEQDAFLRFDRYLSSRQFRSGTIKTDRLSCTLVA